MLIKIIYQIIILFIIIVIVYDVFKEKSKMMKITGALLLIPLILRFLMIK